MTNGNGKICIRCDCALVENENWSPAKQSKKIYICKPCFAEGNKKYAKAYRAKNKVKAASDLKDWRLNNPEAYAAQRRRYCDKQIAKSKPFSI